MVGFMNVRWLLVVSVSFSFAWGFLVAPGACTASEPTATWRALALQRIAHHRTAKLAIIVNGADGNPVTDAKVEVNFRGHEFGFANAVSLMLIGVDEGRDPVTTWHTCGQQRTSPEGRVAFPNAFVGDYSVKVTHEGTITQSTVRHTRGAATAILSLGGSGDRRPPDASMNAADQPAVVTFAPMKAELKKHWPKNRLVRMVFHGHSVPAGYFNTPTVRRYDSYPTLFHQQVCQAYPAATIDLAVTAIGGEQSEQGAVRFERDVLSLRPDVVFIDYAMNDRGIGLPRAKTAWQSMIEACLTRGIPVVLLTSTPTSQEDIQSDQARLALHAAQTRALGEKYNIPVVDSYAMFQGLVEAGSRTNDFLSHPVHPNRAGHQLVADLLFEQFQSFE